MAAAVLLAPDIWAGRRLEMAADAPDRLEMARSASAATGRLVQYRTSELGDGIGDVYVLWRFLARPGYQVDIAALKVSPLNSPG